MQITQIKRGKDGTEKFHLYIDGRYLLTVHEQVCLQQHLRVGQQVTGEDLDFLEQCSQEIWAKAQALSHLSRRSMTAQQLRDKLETHYSPEVVEAAVARMTELGYLNDGDYAARLARDMARLRHFGSDRIRRELLARGIDRETVEQTLEELESDPQQEILSLLGSKLERLAGELMDSQDPKVRNRLFGRLARMGYSFEEIRSAWEAYCEKADAQ